MDVDDLVVIALALGATPNSLIMDPRLADEGDEQDDEDQLDLDLTSKVTTSPGYLWGWLDGQRQLFDSPVADPQETGLVFQDRNRPKLKERTSLGELKDVWDAQAIEASHGDILMRLQVIEEQLGIHHGSD